MKPVLYRSCFDREAPSRGPKQVGVVDGEEVHEHPDDHRHTSSRRHGPFQCDGRSIPTTTVQGNEE